MTTTPTCEQATPDTLPAPPAEHHLVEQGTGSRITVCGRIPPWDLEPACSAGNWAGEAVCRVCGGAYCPRCLEIANANRKPSPEGTGHDA